MLRKITIFCVSLYFVLIIINGPLYAQSDASVGNTKPGAVAPDTWTPNSNLLQAALGSAVLTPNLFVGSAGNWAYLSVDVFVPDFANQTKAPISWQGTFPANWTPSTCTWVISSVPPGPATISLGNAAAPLSTAMVVDSLTGVVPYNTSGWFPVGGPTANQAYVWLTATANWYTDTSDPSKVKAGEFPTLQWSPATVTLIYQ